MTHSEIKELFAYNVWANQRIVDSIIQLSPEQFSRSLGGSHGSIHGTLAHLAAAEMIWLERWQGKAGTKLLPEQYFDTIEKATRRLTEIDAEMMDFINQFPESDLEKSKSYTTTEGKIHSNLFRHMFSHLLNHSTYHRGQLAALLRLAGAVPIPTDLIIYYRQIKAPLS
jgi:uncharacterized damage-inducible protein DinB